MKIKYIIYKENDYYVSQCLNFDVSSFGDTSDDAKKNLKEALSLYLEDNKNDDYRSVDEVNVGELVL